MCTYDIIHRVWQRHLLFEIDEAEIYAYIESCVYLFFYINRIQDTHTHTHTNYKPKIQTSTMAKKRASKTQKGGWGGWARTTHVGPAWNGSGNGGNHFALSKAGVPSGSPIPVPAFWGPGMHQANRLVPHLSPKALSMGGGGSKSKLTRKRTNHKHNRSRSKRGGFVFGGFPQDLKIGWDNLKIGAQNIYRGFMGTTQLNSASPWHQPALKNHVQPPVKPVDINAIRNAAQARVAKLH
jgi:hypothetical protein